MSLDTYGSGLLKAVEEIYGSAADPSRWPIALQAISDVLNDAGALLIWGKDDGSFGTIVSEQLSVAQRDYEQNWSSRDIRGVRAIERGFFLGGEPFTDRHLVSEVEEREDPFYSEFLRKHNLGWLGSIVVSPDPRVWVALAVQRDSNKKSRYSDAELAVLARIGPHIEKSLRLSIRLLDSELINTGLGDALARIGIGIFALDSMGQVIFSNPAAKRLVGPALNIINNRLRIGFGAERIQNDAKIAAQINSEQNVLDSPKPILVHRSSSDRPLVIYLLPIRRPLDFGQQILTNARSIVLVIEPTDGEPTDPSVVRDLLGLTLGEARVAAQIGTGRTPRQAAEKLGISEETARNVLKKVFAKVGVSRQSELVALMTKLVIR